MQNKKTILIAAALLAVIAILAGVYLITRPETVQGAKTITVTVVHKDGTSKNFTYHTDEEYVGAVVTKAGLITGEQGDFGMYIKVVDGESAVYEIDKAYWAFYEGEEYAMQGIDLTPAIDGGVYKLVYTLG